MDIATALEGYLEDLDTITIQLHDGATNLNFAQAALLIQVHEWSNSGSRKRDDFLHLPSFVGMLQ